MMSFCFVCPLDEHAHEVCDSLQNGRGGERRSGAQLVQNASCQFIHHVGMVFPHDILVQKSL